MELENTHALRAHLCGDEVVIVTIDLRTGRLNLRDTGDLAAAGRGPRFTSVSERLNENPAVLLDALVRLRLHVRSPSRLSLRCASTDIFQDHHRPGRAKG
jgi:hypothetical protein